MPGINCSVYACDNNLANTKNSTPKIVFYSFPGREWETNRKKTWINFVRRKKPDGKPWQPSKYSTICSAHFIGNQKSQHPHSPSFNPTIHPLDKKACKEGTDERFKRAERRATRRATTSSEAVEGTAEDYVEDKELTVSIATQTDESETQGLELKIFIALTSNGESATQVSHVYTADAGTNTNVVQKLDQGCGSSTRATYFAGAHDIIRNESALKDLTGATIDVFSEFLGFLPVTFLLNKELCREDKLLLCLMKMKLGITYASLGYIFGIHHTTASKYFKQVLTSIFERTSSNIFWPSKIAIRENLPKSFLEYYPTTRVIIDCSEIRIEKPAGVTNQINFYSSYKSGFTIKFLIGIAPHGLITFLSKAYGGKATDAFITIDSGFLAKLEAGDIVMADKGFPHIETDLQNTNAILVLPPFASPDTNQFSTKEMTETYNIACVRIHVERVIQRIKVYRILSNRMPINLLPFVDKILHVCCLLVNLQPLIINESTPC